ncbi:pilus assembly protein [Lysobacter cavernae]|uniref:Pilus assembly protein n=1 Tax=Lysobacter cavernae TaxID=1685901 RepID=A0ABV7RMP8_9GAMM
MTTQKTSHHRANSKLALAIAFACTLMGSVTHAAVDVKNIPLKMAETVQPNVLFILDDSGSMEYLSMPADEDDSLSDNPRDRGSAVNTIYYDPTVTYRGWRQADDTYMADRLPSSAYSDKSLASGSTDLTRSNQTFYVLNAGATDLSSNGSYKRYVLYSNSGGAAECTWSTSWSCTTVTEFPWRLDSKNNKPTVAQEWQNYANWYSYHRTRMKVAKAGASEAFGGLNRTDYRVGLDTIWGGRNGSNLEFPIPVGTENGVFSGTNRTNWFTKLFEVEGGGRTPLIPALTSAGEYFKLTGNDGPYGGRLSADNKQLQCRQNFAILTTDGYWNEGSTAIGNVDNTEGVDVLNSKGETKKTYTPELPYKDSWSNTLADVAMQYWKNDLRGDMANIVPASAANPAFWQHMVTFGVSIGLKGTLDPVKDMAGLRDGTKSWPSPFTDSNGDGRADEGPWRIDDLLHAAVNGRGSFVAASNPEAFKRSLQEALATITNLTYSRSNVSANSTALREGTHVYQASYVGGSWTGGLKAYPVREVIRNGKKEEEISPTPTWSATVKYSGRKVLTEGGNFPSAAAKATLDAVDVDIVDYLKGDQSKELSKANGKFRNRSSLLGDIVYSSPAFVEGDVPITADQPDVDDTVYVGANDGMLHAFNADDGTERFAYVPDGLDFAKLAKLADPKYPHYFFVDGPVVVSTRQQTRTTAHPDGRNILVGTLGRGGKGMYALDVTDVTQPTVLWDNTWNDTVGTDSGIDKGATSAWSDKDKQVMAHITNPPFITRMNDGSLGVITGNGLHLKDSDGAVTADEIDQGALFVVNLETGAVIKKLVVPGTNNSLSAPRGWDTDRDGDVDYVYAGDLQGNVWKFDLTNADPDKWGAAYGTDQSPAPMFVAKDKDGKRQPISGGLTVAVDPTTYSRMVLFGTGRFLTDDDPGDKSVQTIYGLIDDDKEITGRSELTQRKIVTEEITKEGVVVRGFEPANTALDKDTRGWYMDLLDPDTKIGAEGERVFGQPRNEAGVLLITSGIPSGDPCDPNGTGFTYAIDAFTGSSLSEQYWDTNNDGVVDKKDNVGNTTAGGIGHNNMLTDSITLQGNDGQGKVISGDFAGGRQGLGNQSQMMTGRISWREIMGD